MNAIERTQDEVNEILAGMDAAMTEYTKQLEAKAPRCHFTPMDLDGWSDEAWWECRHCGHTKEA